MEDKIALGIQAESLLKNEIFVRAMSSVRQGIFDKWENSPITDIEGQHELRLMLKILKDFQANIQVIVDDGKMAKFDQEPQPRTNI